METNRLPIASQQQGHMVSKPTANKHLDPTVSSRLRPMASKAPMEVRVKGETLMDSKDPMEARAVAAVVAMEARLKEQVEEVAAAAVVVLVMEDGVMVKVEAKVDGLVIAQRVAVSEAEVAAVMTAGAAMIAVGDMTAVVAMTVAGMTAVEEEDLLVWGKLQSATAPKVFRYVCKIRPVQHTIFTMFT